MWFPFELDYYLFYSLLFYIRFYICYVWISQTQRSISQKKEGLYSSQLSDVMMKMCVRYQNPFRIINFAQQTNTVYGPNAHNLYKLAFGFYCIRISKFNDHLVYIVQCMCTIVYLDDFIMPLSVVYFCIISKYIFFKHIKGLCRSL